jgi:hypothetical protein
MDPGGKVSNILDRAFKYVDLWTQSVVRDDYDPASL